MFVWDDDQVRQGNGRANHHAQKAQAARSTRPKQTLKARHTELLDKKHLR